MDQRWPLRLMAKLGKEFDARRMRAEYEELVRYWQLSMGGCSKTGWTEEDLVRWAQEFDILPGRKLKPGHSDLREVMT